MFFGFTEEEKIVQKSVRDLLQKHCPIERVRAFMETPSVSRELATIFANQGFLGVLEPNKEKINGLTNALLIAREAGRAVLPYPMIENVIALYILKNCNQHDDLINKVEKGNAVLTMAWRNDHSAATQEGDGFALSGTLQEVPFASDADKIIANVRIAGSGLGPAEEETIVIIDCSHPSVYIRKKSVLDETYPLYEVTLTNYPFTKSDVVQSLGMGAGRKLMEKARRLGALLLASEMVGTSERALYESVEYTKQRKQFGTVIATFQALKHMAADMYLLVESAKAAVEYAAWAMESGSDDADLAVSIAKSYSSNAAKKVTGDAIQMHGGIGFTWECDMHLFFKRATRSAALLGDTYTHNEKIAKYALIY